MSEQETTQSAAFRWLQLLAAVGIPLLLAYLAFASLVNPQFAELRELVSSNRDAIAANTSSIERLEAKIDSNKARLEARIDLVAEVLILAITNENITEDELRNLLNAGEE